LTSFGVQRRQTRNERIEYERDTGVGNITLAGRLGRSQALAGWTAQGLPALGLAAAPGGLWLSWPTLVAAGIAQVLASEDDVTWMELGGAGGEQVLHATTG